MTWRSIEVRRCHIEESLSPSGELFGRNRMIEVVRQHAHEPSSRIVRALHGAVRDYRSGDGQHNDATAIVVKFNL